MGCKLTLTGVFCFEFDRNSSVSISEVIAQSVVSVCITDCICKEILTCRNAVRPNRSFRFIKKKIINDV